MLIPIAIILAGFYFYAIIEFILKRNYLKIPGKTTASLKYLHFGLLILLQVMVILSNYNIYLRGYWTTKILIWVCMLAAMTLFIFGQKGFQNKIERIYYGLIFYSPIFTIILIAIPFLGSHIIASVFYCMIGTKDDIEYYDNNYRLQNIYHGFMGPPYPPDLFIKRGLLEYRQKLSGIDYPGDCGKITIEDKSDKEITIIFHQYIQNEDTSSQVVSVHLDH